MELLYNDAMVLTTFSLRMWFFYAYNSIIKIEINTLLFEIIIVFILAVKEKRR